MGTRGFSLGVQRPGRESHHSPPSSAVVKNAWSCTFTPSRRGAQLKAWGQLYFIFYWGRELSLNSALKLMYQQLHRKKILQFYGPIRNWNKNVW
jgi:hypothetical protein